jgi:hypothetical protein
MNFKLLTMFSLPFLIGCYSPLIQMDEVVNARQQTEFKSTSLNPRSTIDAFLQSIFTDEAYQAIKDVPIVTGPLFGTGLASGTSGTSKFLSLFMFADFDRRVVLSEVGIKEYGIEGVIHELIHQLDDLTRGGDASFIDIDEFLAGYRTCATSSQYYGICRFVENRNPDGWISTFGVGEHAERIAFCGQLFWKQGGPPELERAFRHIFRKFHQKYPD